MNLHLNIFVESLAFVTGNPPVLEFRSCLLDPRIDACDSGNISNQVDVANLLHVLLNNPGYRPKRDT